MSAVLASDCSDHWSIPAMMTMMTLWVRAALTGSGAPCWVTRGLPMLARPAPAWLHHLLMMVSSLSQVSASASSESEPGLTGLDGPLPVFNSSTSVIHSGKQRLTVLNLNFWGLGWPWGSDKDVRYDLSSPLQLIKRNFNFNVYHCQFYINSDSDFIFQNTGVAGGVATWQLRYCAASGLEVFPHFHGHPVFWSGGSTIHVQATDEPNADKIYDSS